MLGHSRGKGCWWGRGVDKRSSSGQTWGHVRTGLHLVEVGPAEAARGDTGKVSWWSKSSSGHGELLSDHLEGSRGGLPPSLSSVNRLRKMTLGSFQQQLADSHLRVHSSSQEWSWEDGGLPPPGTDDKRIGWLLPVGRLRKALFTHSRAPWASLHFPNGLLPLLWLITARIMK